MNSWSEPVAIYLDKAEESWLFVSTVLEMEGEHRRRCHMTRS